MKASTKLSIGTIIVSLFVTMAFGSVSRHQRNKSKPSQSNTKDGFQLSVELDQQSYRLGDTATMKIKLRNIGHFPITIFSGLAWGPSSSLTLGISSDRSKLAQKTFLDDAQHHPPFKVDAFIAIQPGEVVEKE